MVRRVVRRLLMPLVLCAAAVAAIAFGLVPLPAWLPGGAAGRPAPAGRAAADHAAPDHAAAAPPKPPEAVAVTVAAAQPRTVERRVRTVGTLHGFEEIVIGPLVDGRVRRIVHDVGDVVPQGEPLLEIDDADFLLAVGEASRALELELARIGLAKVPDASFDVLALPSVERARVVEKNAAGVLERYRGLMDSKTITKDEFEKAQVGFDTARLDVRQRILEAEQTLAAVRHREAVLETARKRLRDTRVIAPETTVRVAPAATPGGAVTPLAYTVAARLVSEGEIVRAAPPTQLFRLVVEDVLKLRAAVPERYAAQVKPGQTADVTVESLPGRAVAGRVARVNPTIDTASRTFEVEVQVDNGGRLLKSGGFAAASILLGTDAEAVTVPEEAIVRFAGVTKLFAVADGRATAVPVELGVRFDVPQGAGPARRWVEVVGGVAAGTPVVLTGHSQLADGTAVRVREPVQVSAAAERDAR